MLHALALLRHTLALTVAATSLAPARVAAQAATAPLSAEDCVQRALYGPARRALAAAGRQAWMQRERAARAGARPDVRGHAGFSFAPLSGYDPAMTDGGEMHAVVGIEQPLYDGGRARGELQLARAGAAQARTGLAVADADLALEVRLAFVDHWAVAQRTRVLRQAVEGLSAEYETSARLARGGSALRSDALRLAAQLEAERAELTAAQADVRAAHLRLAVTMGVDPDSLGAVEDSLRLAPPAAGSDAGSAADVVQAAQATAVAQAEADARRADGVPRLWLEGDAGTRTSVERWRDAGFDAGLGYQMGVVLEVPLWDGGVRAGSRSAAAAEVRARQAAQSIAERRARGTERAELAAQDAAEARADGLRKAEDWAAQAADLIHVRWAGGAASTIELLEAHRTRTEFALARVEARADAARSQARRLRAAGDAP